MSIKHTYNAHLDHVTVELPCGGYLEHRQSDNPGHVELVITAEPDSLHYFKTLRGLAELRDAVTNLLDTPEDEG